MRNYGVELSSVGGRSYVTIGTTGYRMPDDIRGLLVRKSARGRNGLTRTIEQLGIAPWRWETAQQFAGTEQLDGVKVQKVTTGFTAGQILKDANTLLEVLGSLTLTRVTGVRRHHAIGAARDRLRRDVQERRVVDRDRGQGPAQDGLSR